MTPPDDTHPTDQRRTKPFERLVRFVIGGLILGCWFAVSMSGASDSTSWEHHPFGGPFTLLKESVAEIDFVVSGLILGAILASTAAWIWTGRLLTAFVSIALSGFSIWMTICLAAWASC